MQAIVLVLASLLFDAGAATVQANPELAARAVSASFAKANAVCCPEWLCQLLCGILCGSNCEPGGRCCTSGGSCCGG